MKVILLFSTLLFGWNCFANVTLSEGQPIDPEVVGEDVIKKQPHGMVGNTAPKTNNMTTTENSFIKIKTKDRENTFTNNDPEDYETVQKVENQPGNVRNSSPATSQSYNSAQIVSEPTTYQVPQQRESYETPVASSSSSSRSIMRDLEETWVVEGMLSFDSVAESSSPLVGAALSSHVTENNALGVRTFMPITLGTDKTNVYQAGAFWRYFVVNRKTRLFGELSGTYNTVEFKGGADSFGSLGLAIGVRHQLNREISLGGTAGIDFTSAEVDDDGAYVTSNTMLIQPKLAFVGGFHF